MNKLQMFKSFNISVYVAKFVEMFTHSIQLHVTFGVTKNDLS